MNGGLSQFARVSANISLRDAMGATVTDPVADAHFARSRHFGALLEESLARTDAMLALCECGRAKVFCKCDFLAAVAVSSTGEK